MEPNQVDERILEEAETAGCLPQGWRVASSQGYFTAFFGEELHTSPKTSLRLACEAAWTLHAGASLSKSSLRANFVQTTFI